MKESGLDEFLAREQAFFAHLLRWQAALPAFALGTEVSDPARVAVCSADMTLAFCCRGNLASPRVAALIGPVLDLFRRTHAAGVRHYVLLQDAHSPHTPEFASWPPHGVAGSEEAETIPELRNLPFSGLFTVVPKNSLSPAVETSFDAWLEQRPDLRDFIVVGNCTDLCVYQLAMHLRMRANALNQQGRRVIVPADCVQTYDLPVEAARGTGAFPHPGDLFHVLFLYHMALGGCQVVREVV